MKVDKIPSPPSGGHGKVKGYYRKPRQKINVYEHESEKKQSFMGWTTHIENH